VLDFNSGNWNAPQAVTVTAANLAYVDGPATSVLTFAVDDAASDDLWDLLANQTVTATAIDNDPAEIVITESGGSTSATEGAIDVIQVSLGAGRPFDDVVLTVTSADPNEASVSPPTLTFTTANWNIAQELEVTAEVEDFVDGDRSTQIVIAVSPGASDNAFDTVTARTVNAATIDDDDPAFTITQTGGTTIVNEDGGIIDTLLVVLTSRPLTPVSFNLSSDDTGEANVSALPITFDSITWQTPDTIVVTGADDSVADGPQSSTITVAIDAGGSDPLWGPTPPGTVDVTTTDDEFPALVVSESAGSTVVNESGPGQTDTIRVRLNVEPVDSVVLDVSSDDPSASTVGTSRLTFTNANWDQDQPIVVTGVPGPGGSRPSNVVIEVDDAASDPPWSGLSQSVDVTTMNVPAPQDE
jgi:hypothetical protein